MKKIIWAVAALSLGLGLAAPPGVLAWHLASKRACMRDAPAPDCGPKAVAVCKSRQSCAIEPHKIIRVCAEWRCRLKR